MEIYYLNLMFIYMMMPMIYYMNQVLIIIKIRHLFIIKELLLIQIVLLIIELLRQEV